MIDLKQLRENPARFRDGAAKKNFKIDFDRLLALEEKRRALMTEQETLRAEQKKIEKDLGPQLGRLTGEIKKAADDAQRQRLQLQLTELKARPAGLKQRIQSLDDELAAIEPEFNTILLQVPLPPDPNVPVGAGAEQNVEIRRWNPPGSAFDP